MAGRVGVLRAESRSECVHIAERLRERLNIQLAGDCHIDRFAEEILRVVYLPVLRHRNFVERQGRDLEHLACAFRIGSRYDRGMDIHKVALLEKFVDRIGDQGAHTEDSLESVRPGTKMRHGPQELERVTLLLERIIRCGCTFHLHALRLDLKGLLCVRRSDELARHDDSRADIEPADLGEIRKALAIDDLKCIIKRSVVDDEESERLGSSVVPDPSADLYGPVDESVCLLKELAYCYEFFHSVTSSIFAYPENEHPDPVLFFDIDKDDFIPNSL